MTALAIVRVIAVITTGLAAGIFLGHRMGVSFARLVLSPSSFVQLQQVIHRYFVRMMPPLMLGAVGTSIAWVVLSVGRPPSLAFWLVAAAALAMVVAAVLTRVVNVPINARLMTWRVDAPPADLVTLWAPWERIHSVRTVLAVAAFVAEVIGMAISANVH
jgi:uncharacterized membrane protein